MSDYTPIDCNYYDFIEHTAIRRKVVEIVYDNEKGEPTQIETRILDTKVTNGEEFVILEAPPLTLRMDRLISIDGKPVPNRSCEI